MKVFILIGLFLFSVAVVPVSAANPDKAKAAAEKVAKIKKAKKNLKKRARVAKKVKKKKSARKKKIAKRKSVAKLKKAKVKKQTSSLARSLKMWLKKMKKRVARSHAKHNQLVTVASVRGSNKTDAPPLYWKGKKSNGPVDLPELEEFDRAINLALGGDPKEAETSLEKFIKKYPKSNLAEDANHTLAMLRKSDKK